MHGDTCTELFAFAVNSISSEKQPNKLNLRSARLMQHLTQSFFGHTGKCIETGTLTKVLESAPSDRPTNKSYGFF